MIVDFQSQILKLLHLALDINKKPDQEATILSDDYSIQNVASTLRYQIPRVHAERNNKKV